DDFASLSAWTVTRLTVSATTGSPSAPSARADAISQTAFAARSLPTTMGQACVSVNVDLASGSGIDVLRLRTAANGALIKVLVAANGTLGLRNDINPETHSTATALGAGWHNVELCGTVGAATSWTLFRDDVLISTWATNTGATPIGIVQLGSTTAGTFAANYDHFVVDTSPGEGAAPPADTAPPTVPGRPTGTSPISSSIQLSWAASTDASPPISYRVYRDGAANPVATVSALTFTDTGLAGGTSHTYSVDAVDAVGNAGAKSQASAAIVVQTGAPAVIIDEFASLSAWTVTRLTLSTTAGSPAAPSARAQVTSQSAYGVRALPATMSQACVSVNVNLASGSGIDLFRLRTAANGALIKVVVAADGTLGLRNDINPATRTTTTALGTGWHNVEMCGTVGAAGSWTLYRDGVLIDTWATNTGTTPIGIVQLGYTSAATFTANYDHFVVDTGPGDGAAPPTDTAPPTVPGRPTGTSPSTSSIQLTWAVSTDATPPISYRVYRDGGATSIGTVTTPTFTDTGLASASTHTYTVDAVDSLGHASAKSTASASIAVKAAPPAVIVDEFANLSAWTVTRLTVSTTIGSPSAPSARAEVTNQSAFAVRTLPATMSQACVSVNVNLASGSGIDLFRLRTAANGALIKVVVAADGTLGMRNDINPATRTTTTALGTGWHNVEMCGTVGAAGSWTLYRDGVLINTWTTNTGTTPIGLVQLGYTSAGTFTANYDHFVVDNAAG
ncbi:MAG: regulator of chromosome condensation, partial [Ilumatobacteraceae bacterium]|nr:regulator of chromosome condensation [Ilumatobacteraceae bacterium]